MTESDVKRKMSESMRDHKGYARRLEDSFGVGVFDMILIPWGGPVFLAEVKIIRANVFGPSPRQMIELTRIQDVAADGGHVIPVMIGYKGGNYYFHKPQMKIRYDECFTGEGEFYNRLMQYYHSIKGRQIKEMLK